MVIGNSRSGSVVLPVAAVPSSAPVTVTSSLMPATCSDTLIVWPDVPWSTDCVAGTKPGASTRTV